MIYSFIRRIFIGLFAMVVYWRITHDVNENHEFAIEHKTFIVMLIISE